MDRRRIPLRALHSEDPYAIARGRPRPPADCLLGQPSPVDDRFAHRGRAAPPSRPIRRRRNVSKAAALVPRATLRLLTLATSPRQKRGSEIAIAPIVSKTGMSAPVCRPSSSRKLTTRWSGGGAVKTPPNTAPSDYPGVSAPVHRRRKARRTWIKVVIHFDLSGAACPDKSTASTVFLLIKLACVSVSLGIFLFRIRQDRDHPTCRAIALAGSADIGKARHSQIVFLPLV